MIEKYGFVYIWYDRKHKRYYIGCHWGHVNDGYICSSTWMNQSYKRRPEDFKRKILKTNILNKKLMFEEEFRYFNMIKLEELGKRYYNLTLKYYNHWITKEDISFTIDKMKKVKRSLLSEEHKEKLRKPHKNPRQKGYTLTEEHKRNIKKSVTNNIICMERPPRSEEWSSKLRVKRGIHKNPRQKGYTLTEEHKRNISNGLKNSERYNK